MSIYVIPEEYYFRIHHVRPRFKNDIENVLFYVAEEIVSVGLQEKDEFVKRLNSALFRYPGNAHRALKTINNWRTEISSLFGFIEHYGDKEGPARRAIELAEKQDLVEFFKVFLYTFQYPGAHVKSQYILEQIVHGIKFKPAQYILKVLKEANKNGGNAIGITKGEVCHCIFNDLRVTRDNEGAEKTWARITENRRCHCEYDMTGDVVRYASDIMDYMEIANLLKTYDGITFYLNTLEEEAIIKFIESTEWFSGYDEMIAAHSSTTTAIASKSFDWFKYVNRDLGETDFSTDILAYIAEDENQLSDLKSKPLDEEIAAYFEDNKELSTKNIGDLGECLVHAHECMRVKIGGRPDLIHLIKRIPTQFAVGYDINSVELDERKRFIEVKTTISARPLHFNRVHMTKNEWNAAETTRDRYFVYRLLLSKKERKLFLLQDPVGLYKNDKINMVPNDGADITFDTNIVGRFEELLAWAN